VAKGRRRGRRGTARHRPGAPGPTGSGRVAAQRYGWGPLIVISLVVATAPAEAGSISVGLDSIKAHFHVSDFWLGALPFFMSFVGIFWRFVVGWLTDRMRRVTLLSALIAVYAVLMGCRRLRSRLRCSSPSRAAVVHRVHRATDTVALR